MSLFDGPCDVVDGGGDRWCLNHSCHPLHCVERNRLRAELVGLRAERDAALRDSEMYRNERTLAVDDACTMAGREITAKRDAAAWREDAERLAQELVLNFHGSEGDPDGCDSCAALAAHRLLVESHDQ